MQRRLISAWAFLIRSEPAIDARGVLAIALLAGLLSGMLQGVHVIATKAISPLAESVLNRSAEAVWMAPIGEGGLLFAAGLVAVVLTRAWKKPVSLRLVVFSFASAAAFGVLRSLRLGIGTVPLAILALGIAVRLAASAGRHAAALRRHGMAAIAICTAWVVVSALALHGGRAVREWRTLHALPEPDNTAPDVILLILDTVRSHDLGLYGFARPTTPRLSELAAESAVFDGAVAVSSWTLPSHASMLTGQEPWDLAVRWRKPLEAGPLTIAELLRSRGYATGGFVANLWYAGRDAGMSRGFARFRDVPITADMTIRNSWVANGVVEKVRDLRGIHATRTMDARTIADLFLDWSRRVHDRPYFAMLNFMDAHAPYVAPDSVLERFTTGRPLNWLEDERVYSEKESAELRTAYDAAIAYIDQEIGRIIDSLRVRDRLDQTLIIVTADHGEQFGEHSPALHSHGNSLFASALQVPLLIRYPARVPGGLRIAATVSTARIAATIADLAVGVDSGFPGRSLARDFDTVAQPVAIGSPVLSFLRPLPSTVPSDPVARGPMASSILGRWHYIRNGDGTEELYDIETDPWETRNRAGDPALAAILRDLRPPASMLDSIGASVAAGAAPDSTIATSAGPTATPPGIDHDPVAGSRGPVAPDPAIQSPTGLAGREAPCPY